MSDHKLRGSYIILDPDTKGETTTWPRPDDPDDVTWRLIHSPETLTEHDRMYLRSVVAAYGSLCLHPARTQRSAGRVVRRLGRAVDSATSS